MNPEKKQTTSPRPSPPAERENHVPAPIVCACPQCEFDATLENARRAVAAADAELVVEFGHLPTAEQRISELRRFVERECILSDKSSHEWQPDQSVGCTNLQAAYRSGMWYAYRQIQNLLGPEQS